MVGRVTQENLEQIVGQVLAQVRGASPELFMLAVRYMISAYGPPDWGWSRVESAMRNAMRDEEREMLSTAAKELFDQGRIEGHIEGKREGKLEGEAKALTLILERRFRSLPAEVASRIASASPGELESWLGRSVDAPCLDAVFSERIDH